MQIDLSLLLSWLEFAVRWTHVIVAIAWIGASFYFIALDLGLRKQGPLPAGVLGEEWQVHGGGFYHVNKYLVAPANLPEHLVWFKWESYFTWLSGAALLALVYWVGGEIYLIDPGKVDFRPWQAALVSAASLTVGWLVYDRLCRSPLGGRPTLLMLLLFALLLAMSLAYHALFTGRAALLHIGAFTATIMTANVFFVIMPNQRIVVADLKAGRTPDPKYGKIAKLRSTHNNYLTLPVIFLMLSTHYPLAFGTDYAWAITALVFLMGVSIRHFFNHMHATGGYARGERLWWTWVATIGVFLLIVWLSSLGTGATAEQDEARFPTWQEQRFQQAEGFEDAQALVAGYCSMCHARAPLYPGIHRAPKGIHLETANDVARHAAEIYLFAARSRAMPPPAVARLDDEDRALLARWYRAGQRG